MNIQFKNSRLFQLEGKIRLVAKSEDLVTLTVSKHGVKVLDRQKRVSYAVFHYRPHQKDGGRYYFQFVCHFTPATYLPAGGGGGRVPTFQETGYLPWLIGGYLPWMGIPTHWLEGRYPPPRPG